MIELSLLGSPDLRGDATNGAAGKLLAKPKLMGLLAYLVVARPGGWFRRDELTAIFWPESDQAHARTALRQAIYQLRQHLGPSALEARGSEEVRVPEGAIRCDVLEVKAAIEAGKTWQALDHYQGPLLPGFHLPDDGDFTHWLDVERTALCRTLAKAASEAGERAAEAGDLDRAIHACREAVALEPLDSDIAARSMSAMAAVGECATALEVFEIHRRALAQILEADPDENLQELARRLEEVPKAVVVPPVPVTALVHEAEVGEARPVERRWWSRRRAAVAALSVTMLVVLAVLLGGDEESNLDPGLVAVLPFAFEGTQEDRWLAGAIPVGLVPLLDGTGGVQAVSDQRMSLALGARGKTWDQALSAEEARETARATGAGRYLAASIVSSGGRRRLFASLVDTESGDDLQRVTVELDTLDLNAAIDRLATELLLEATGSPTPNFRYLSRSAEALRHYVNGRAARREQRHLDALRHFHDAMNLDSTFALAALAYREVAMWMPDGTPHRRALLLADSILARHPDRMSEQDRAVAAALLHTQRMVETGAEALQGIRRGTLIAPERPVAWLLLGDFLLHDGPMLGLSNPLALATAAFDSARGLGDVTPEAERHLIEIRLAERDTAFARSYLVGHPRDTTAFSHLWWVAASLAGDTAALEDFGRTLDREPPSTWRWMIKWSQRAETGFPQADRAATLLAAGEEVDPSVRWGNEYLLAFYWLNRGRPTRAAMEVRRLDRTARYSPALMRLEIGLASPVGWVDVGAAARLVEQAYGTTPVADQLPAACDLGMWYARIGREPTAQGWADSVETWRDDSNERRRSFARACSYVIREASHAGSELADLQALDRYLRDEPPGTYRHDLTLWNLFVARLLAARGRPDLALPMTTRLGYNVEVSVWLLPALVWEGQLSLVTGDTARAARAYSRAARLLSDPEPAFEPQAREIRNLARVLTDRSGAGPPTKD